MQLALDFRESPSRWRTAMLCFRAAEAADDQLIEVNALIEATERAGRNYEREPLPAHLKAAWPPAFLKAYQNRKERDEYQVLREGIRDLERLLQKAVRAFKAIKLTRP